MSIDVHGILGMSAAPQAPLDGRVAQRDAAAGKQAAKQQKISSTARPPEIGAIVKELQMMSALNRRLKFTVNPDLDRVIVKVVDRQTDKVIKELPPEGIQRLYAKIQEAIGLLIDEEI
jgi:flagellar protein FlaG